MAEKLTRTAYLRVSTIADLDAGSFAAAVRNMNHFAAEIAQQAADLDATFSVTTDPVSADEHPERDRLLALTDSWRNDAAAVQPEDTPDHQATRAALIACADELVRLVATLNL